MKIKFWGCRGSIPVPDIRMMKYGGDTTSVEIDLDGELFLIDAGTGIRKLGESLLKRKIYNFNVFVTHSHWDHIQGFPFFTPIYSEKAKIHVIGCTNSYKQLKDILSSQMSYEFFPISFHDLKSKITFSEVCSNQLTINGYKIKTIQTNHAIFTSAVRIEKNGKSFVFMTDNELESKNPINPRRKFIEFCKGADYLIHDSQFTDAEYTYRKNWGHSTFEQSIKLAEEARVKNLGFFHHDPNRKDTDLAALSRKYCSLSHSNGYKFKIFTVKQMDEIRL